MLSIKLAALFIVRCTKFGDVKMRIMKEIWQHPYCWGEINPFIKTFNQPGGGGMPLISVFRQADL